jgi:hypothetical protein
VTPRDPPEAGTFVNSSAASTDLGIDRPPQS